MKLDQIYSGTKANGQEFHVENEDGQPASFRCYLDIGLARATTGAKIFGVLKGAVDAGLDMPHSNKRFPGYNKESKEYNAEVHRQHIFGVHVAEYMKSLQEDNEELYKKQFSQYIKNGIDASNVEEMYERAHEKIRLSPDALLKEKKVYPEGSKPKMFRKVKLSREQREDKVKQKKEAFLKKQNEENMDD